MGARGPARAQRRAGPRATPQTGISLRYILDFGEQPLARQVRSPGRDAYAAARGRAAMRAPWRQQNWAVDLLPAALRCTYVMCPHCAHAPCTQMLLSARFLQTELPIRLAHRIAELNALPPLLSNNLHVERVKKW